MNKNNLHEFINRYEENIDLIYGDVHDELFKWQAMKVWRDEWFKPDIAFASFAERFNAARKEFSLFIDNSRMHPSTGVVKLWEKEPETVERLFYEVRPCVCHTRNECLPQVEGGYSAPVSGNRVFAGCLLRDPVL